MSDPTIPVVRNVDGGVTRSGADVRRYLLSQVSSPVRWTACVERLAREGAGAFVEVGPGRVLTSLRKRISEGIRGYSIEDPTGLEETLAALGKS